MTGFLDTNVVIRYITNDPPRLADRAAAILDSDEDFEVTGVVLAEAAHVLASYYRLSRAEIIDALLELLQRENVHTSAIEKAFIIQGLQFCRPSNRVSVPDAMIWAAARSSGVNAVYSFDDRFPAESIDLRRQARAV